jgi:hypothetical protein
MIHGKQIQDTSIRETKFNIQGDFSLNNYIIINAGTPTNPHDLANKEYVDAVVQGLSVKEEVYLKTNTLNDLSNDGAGADPFVYIADPTDEWTNVETPTFDGKTVNDGDRVLITHAENAKGNGIWIYDFGATKFFRAEDANNKIDEDSNNEVRGGMFTFVTNGDNWVNTGWVLTGAGTKSLGIDNLIFVQFTGVGLITAGNGLNKSGNTIFVIHDGDSTSSSSAGIKSSSLFMEQKQAPVAITFPGADASTNISISYTPAGDSDILILLNGIYYDISYGAATGVFYFKDASGENIRAKSTIIASDILWFSPTNAGFGTAITDEITLVYSKIN